MCMCRYLRHLGVSHLDLKPSNILLTKVNGAMVCKVADFGFAMQVGHTERVSCDARGGLRGQCACACARMRVRMRVRVRVRVCVRVRVLACLSGVVVMAAVCVCVCNAGDTQAACKAAMSCCETNDRTANSTAPLYAD